MYLINMDYKQIIETTKKMLSEEFEIEIDEIKPENNFHQILNLDSLDYVDLVVIVSENFGVVLNADDIKKIQTFNDFYTCIENKKYE